MIQGDDMNICIIDAKQFIKDENLLLPLYEIGSVSSYEGIPESFDQVIERGKDADIILFAVMSFTNEMLDNLPNLKVLQFIGTGMWNFVDVEYAAKKGIKVLNIEGYGNNAVAEFALGCVFSLARKITQADRLLKKHTWSTDNLEGIEIEGSTFGVVGTGNIGSIVAKKAHILGAHVLACDIYESDELKNKYGIKYVSLEEIFENSDIISIHMKATKENEKIIGKELFSKMKKGSLFINVARAELVDNKVLYEVLSNGQIAGAAIDVYESEPPADYSLPELNNVIATPHIGFYTKKANDNSIKLSVKSVLSYMDLEVKE